MRPWVKLWTDVFSDANFTRLSVPARHSFLTCLGLAGRCDAGGDLSVRTGPLSVDEIAAATGLRTQTQRQALSELIATGFVAERDRTFSVLNWERYQPPLDTTANARQHKRRRGAVTRDSHGSAERDSHGSADVGVTDRPSVTVTVTDIEEDTESEVDINMAALVAPPVPVAIKDVGFPDSSQSQWAMARRFIAAFSRCAKPSCGGGSCAGHIKSEESIAKSLSGYCDALAQFNARGLTMGAAWEAFARCWLAGGGKPLFSSAAKRALSYVRPTAVKNGRGRYNPNDGVTQHPDGLERFRNVGVRE